MFFDLNPFTHLAVSYQEILFFNQGPVGHWKWLLALGARVGRAVPGWLLAVRSPARLVCGGGMTPAIELAQRLEDLPPLRRPAVLDAEERAAAAQHPARPAAERNLPGADRRSFAVPKGSTYGVIGRNGSGKSTALKLVAGITKPTSGTRPRARAASRR